MRTRITTAHEEEYSDKSRVLGILFNYSIDVEHDGWKDALIYVYRDGTYIFFNTIIDTIDYLLYGEVKMKRAYLTEDEFDEYYDAEFIDGDFRNKLKWS
jgi:hypothetical protein